jgi:hypothetical protein
MTLLFSRSVALYRDIIAVGQHRALDGGTNGVGRTILRREVVLCTPGYMITIASIHVVLVRRLPAQGMVGLCWKDGLSRRYRAVAFVRKGALRPLFTLCYDHSC